MSCFHKQTYFNEDSVNLNKGSNMSTTSTKVESIYWDDDYFRTHIMENNKLAGHVPYQQTKEFAKAFLNWYVSGKGSNKLLDIWIGLVAGMFVPTDSILCQHLLADTIFRGKFGEKGAMILDPINTVNKLNNNDFIYANAGNEFNSNEAKRWYARIFDILQTANSVHSAVPSNVTTVINYLGYIALTLFKVLVKDAPRVSTLIVKYVTNEFNGFWHPANSIIKTRTPPPHKFALQQFEHTFQKTSDKCKRTLTLVVATYAFTDSSHKETVQKILGTACLDYLNLYGMGCLFWLQQAEKNCSTTPQALMDFMATNKNRGTNIAMTKLFQNYINPGKNQFTWRWSRLFLDKTFSDVSISSNPLYAATMAALSCKCDANSPIWKITQFRREALKKEALATARTILTMIQKSKN